MRAITSYVHGNTDNIRSTCNWAALDQGAGEENALGTVRPII